MKLSIVRVTDKAMVQLIVASRQYTEVTLLALKKVHPFLFTLCDMCWDQHHSASDLLVGVIGRTEQPLLVLAIVQTEISTVLIPVIWR